MTLAPRTIYYGGVRRVDSPCIANAERLDRLFLPCVASINRTGLYLDDHYLATLDTELADRESALADSLRSLICNPSFNPGSPDQVSYYLYQELQLSPSTGIQTTKTGRATTDDDTLASMEGQHPFVSLLRSWREVNKLRGTYTKALPKYRDPDGRVRTTVSATRTGTGRLASSKPNLQNIPIRSAYGPKIRDAFIAYTPPGHPPRALLSVDQSQIEMVWAAELSQDRTMIDTIRSGTDMHAFTSYHIFGEYVDMTVVRIELTAPGLPPRYLTWDELSGYWKRYKKEEIKPDNDPDAWWPYLRDFEINKRLPAKTLGFAVLYGVTPAGLRIQIIAAGGPLLEESECLLYIDRWYGLYSGVRDLMSIQSSRVVRHGMVWTAFGRPRLLPQAKSSLKNQRSEAERQAGNTPLQGSAGDSLKLAAAEVYHEVLPAFKALGYCELVLQIHDELIFEAELSMMEDLRYQVRHVMENCLDLSVPIKASASVAERWGGLK